MLREAVEIYRQLLPAFSPKKQPEPWALIQHSQAKALAELALRSEPADALALYGETRKLLVSLLPVYSRGQAPEEWAAVQQDLGGALNALALRSGREQSRELLGEAVAAYRRSLEVRTRQEMPQAWADSQNALANALQDQALRSEPPQAMLLLREAVAAYYGALQVYTREAAPEDWAMAQNNLAIAFKEQALRSTGGQKTKLLADAVAAYGQVLAVYDRQTQPGPWANTRKNQALSLREMGRPAEAAAALREVLEIDPGNTDLALYLIDLHQSDLSDPAAALALAREWQQRHPDEVILQVRVLECLFVSGDFQAAESYAKTIEKNAAENASFAIVVKGMSIAAGLLRGQRGAAAGEIDRLTAQVAAQARPFSVEWGFDSALRTLREAKTGADREEAIKLFEALAAVDRDAMLAGLRALRQRLSA